MKLLFFLFLLFFSVKTLCKVILIDPGHGGHDLGTKGLVLGKKSYLVYEKEMSLKLAQFLKVELQKKHQVYLTRVDDSYVSLDARAKMADTVKADLFLSLHFNSNQDRSAQGIETFYLDNHNDVAVKKVEDVENIGLEGKKTVINHILIDLSIKLTTKESKKLAENIHINSLSALKKGFPVRDRKFKPGLLYVLALSKRPGVLVEGGFMSHKQEMQRINSDTFLKLYAKGIAVGVEKYLQK